MAFIHTVCDVCSLGSSEHLLYFPPVGGTKALNHKAGLWQRLYTAGTSLCMGLRAVSMTKTGGVTKGFFYQRTEVLAGTCADKETENNKNFYKEVWGKKSVTFLSDTAFSLVFYNNIQLYCFTAQMYLHHLQYTVCRFY